MAVPLVADERRGNRGNEVGRDFLADIYQA